MSPTSHPDITADVVLVGPELAAKWLEGNTHNRVISDSYVAGIERDMRAGRWHMTGDTVKFDWNGVLADGQHRLWAVVQSGCTVPMLVVHGVSPEAQDYMDIGKKRSTSDALHLRGRGEYSAKVASTARGVLIMRHTAKQPTQGEILELVEREEEVLVAGARVSRQATTAGLRGGAIYGVAYYYLAHVDPEAVEPFFAALLSGEQLAAGNPILALRRRFLTTPPRVGSSSSHLRVNLAYVYKAWNAWRDHRQLTALRYSLDEPMPTPH